MIFVLYNKKKLNFVKICSILGLIGKGRKDLAFESSRKECFMLMKDNAYDIEQLLNLALAKTKDVHWCLVAYIENIQ